MPIQTTETQKTNILILGSDEKDRYYWRGEGDFQCKTGRGDNYNTHIPLGYDLGIMIFAVYDPWSEMYEYGANTPELEYLNYINSSTF